MSAHMLCACTCCQISNYLIQIPIFFYKRKVSHLLNALIRHPVSSRRSLTETIHNQLTGGAVCSLMEFVHSINKSVKLLFLHVLPVKLGKPL